MKSLLVLLLVSFARGDKLNPAYLPPVGANYSGGSGGDISVPFEVPRNFGIKDGDATKLTPGIFREGGTSSYATPDGTLSSYGPASGISSTVEPAFTKKLLTTYTPSSLPATTSNYDSYTAGPGLNGKTLNRITDGSMSNQGNDGRTFPNQSPTNKGSINLSITSENPFDDDVIVPGKPVSFRPGLGNNDRVTPFDTARYPQRKSRPQEEADRNAVILNYENVITPDGFAYSFDTSNGIHADESGTANDGVRANGSYSYIGDDGKLYNVTYSADENGFRPRGDHLPTPPPIPDAILKVIEQAARDKNNGIFDDGSYDDRKYGFKKYQPLRDRTMGNNSPRVGSSTNQDNNTPSYASSDSINDKSDESVFPGSGFETNNGNKQETNFVTPSRSNNVNPNEVERNNYDIYQNQDYPKSDIPSRVTTGNNFNQDPRDPNSYEYNQSANPNSDENIRNDYNNAGNTSPGGQFTTNYNIKSPDNKNIVIESQNGYNYPNPNQKSQQISNQPTTFLQKVPGYTQSMKNIGANTVQPNEVNPSTERYNGYSTYTDSPNKYNDYSKNYYDPTSTGKTTELESYTGRPNVYFGERIKPVSTYRPIEYNTPSSTEEARGSTSYTDRPRDYYYPSTTARDDGSATYTERPRDYDNPSSQRKPTGSNGRLNNYYGPSSTEVINANSGYYGPTSTERVNELSTYANLPNEYNTGEIKQFDPVTGRPIPVYNGPSAANEEVSTYTDRPIDYYNPSTDRPNEFDKVTGRPNIYYTPTSTEGINQFGSFTDGPNGYSPSSTRRLEEFKSATGRPTTYNPSTGRLRPTGSFTRPNNYYPTSTEGVKQFNTFTGRPTDYYNPSTEGIREFNTATGTPSDYYNPTTERIKQIEAYTGRPTDYYNPSTEGVKEFNTVTGRPSDFYNPFTGRKQIGSSTSRPTDFFAPSTEGIKQFNTATGRPEDFYNPSTVETKQAGPYTGRPVDYSPSTEGIKVFDTTGRPNYSSTTGRITGEDFSGPKQPQRFDPDTGYHY